MAVFHLHSEKSSIFAVNLHIRRSDNEKKQFQNIKSMIKKNILENVGNHA